MNIVFSFLFFLALALSAIAETGVSGFAIMHPKFPCSDFLAQFKGVKSPRIAILSHTFGTSDICLKRFLGLPGSKTVEVHIDNGPARFNRRIGSGELSPWANFTNYYRLWDKNDKRLIQDLTKRARQWAAFARNYPQVRWLMSDGLESRGNATGAKNRIKTIRKWWPYKVVHNPIYPRDNRIVGADFLELHGSTWKKHRAGETIFNLDGSGIGFNSAEWGRVNHEVRSSEVPRLLERARREGVLFFLWDAESQGLGFGDKPFVYPKSRKFVIRFIVLKNGWLKKYG